MRCCFWQCPARAAVAGMLVPCVWVAGVPEPCRSLWQAARGSGPTNARAEQLMDSLPHELRARVAPCFVARLGTGTFGLTEDFCRKAC